MSKPLPRQPEINVGTLGHVDNGKSTLVQAISGVWTARHSEEMKRGITIRIGYADAPIYRCPKCSEPFNYKSSTTCPTHNIETEFVRAISFIDCPGHHSLMVTMLSGAALFDGAIFVLDARVKFPQLQDGEHLQAAKTLGITRLVVAQNKIDLVDRERALKNYEEVTSYLESIGYSDIPIIPVSSQHGVGIEPLLYMMEKIMPTPPRDRSKPFRMPVIRSFDVNPPGRPARELRGAVIGGSLSQGVVRVGDEIELVPGLVQTGKPSYKPLYAEVTSLMAGGRNVDEAFPGGLTGVETTLDPHLGKGDGLVGNIAGKPETLPPVWTSLSVEYQLFRKVLGVNGDVSVKPLAEREPIVVNVSAAITSGVVTRRTSDVFEVALTRPVAAEPGGRVTLSRKVGTGWRLIGYGTIVGG